MRIGERVIPGMSQSEIIGELERQRSDLREENELLRVKVEHLENVIDLLEANNENP